jgi:hypothetical protein
MYKDGVIRLAATVPAGYEVVAECWHDMTAGHAMPAGREVLERPCLQGIRCSASRFPGVGLCACLQRLEVGHMCDTCAGSRAYSMFPRAVCAGQVSSGWLYSALLARQSAASQEPCLQDEHVLAGVAACCFQDRRALLNRQLAGATACCFQDRRTLLNRQLAGALACCLQDRRALRNRQLFGATACCLQDSRALAGATGVGTHVGQINWSSTAGLMRQGMRRQAIRRHAMKQQG